MSEVVGVGTTFHGIAEVDDGVKLTYSVDNVRVVFHWPYGFGRPSGVDMRALPEGEPLAQQPEYDATVYKGVDITVMRRLPIRHVRNTAGPYIDRWVAGELKRRLGNAPARLLTDADYEAYAAGHQLATKLGAINVDHCLAAWTYANLGTIARRNITCRERGYMESKR